MIPRDASKQSSSVIQNLLLKSGDHYSPSMKILMEIERVKKEIASCFTDATMTTSKPGTGPKIKELSALVKKLEESRVKDFSATLIYYTAGNVGYGHVAVQVKFKQYDPTSKNFKDGKPFYLSFDKGSGIVGDKDRKKPDEAKTEETTYLGLSHGRKITIPLPIKLTEDEAIVAMEAAKIFRAAARTEYSFTGIGGDNCATKIMKFFKDGDFIPKSENIPNITTPAYVALRGCKINSDLIQEQQDLLIQAARFNVASEDKLTLFKEILILEIEKLKSLMNKADVLNKPEDIHKNEASIELLSNILKTLESKNYISAFNQLVSLGKIVAHGITKEIEPFFKYFPYDLIPKADIDKKRLFLKDLYTEMKATNINSDLIELLKDHDSQNTTKLHLMFCNALPLVQKLARNPTYAHWNSYANKLISEPAAKPAPSHIAHQPPPGPK